MTEPSSKKINEACGVLIDALGKVQKENEQSIATFLCRGPEGSKYPYLVMAGPAPVMCIVATKTACDFFDRLKERFQAKGEE